MKKQTKKQQQYRGKIKTKASKEQFQKFKECFEEKCGNPSKDKMDKTIKSLSGQKVDKN